MKSGWAKIKQYLPDKSVLDEKPPFDNDLSQSLFHQGNQIGCITLHGIGGTPANIRVVADALIDEGYTVLSPTLPGHGETVRALNASTGEQWVQCVLDAYDQLIAYGCTQIYALGLSLGGVLSALLAETHPLSGLVLICAPIEMQPYLHFARRISHILPFIRYAEKEGHPKSWHSDPYAQMYDGFSTSKLRDLNRLCKQLRKSLSLITCPTLMVTAKYDDKVAPCSIDIYKNRATQVPSIEFLHLENSAHGCTYGPEKALVAERAAIFVRRMVDNSTPPPL
ncbi:MAG: alpha/beta fold hydrolase [Clostridia bacterium]